MYSRIVWHVMEKLIRKNATAGNKRINEQMKKKGIWILVWYWAGWLCFDSISVRIAALFFLSLSGSLTFSCVLHPTLIDYSRKIALKNLSSETLKMLSSHFVQSDIVTRIKYIWRYRYSRFDLSFTTHTHI